MLGINEIIKEKLNKLKAELENVYSRIQADYLLGDIKSLANEAAAFGITVDVSGLEKAVETKVKSFEVDKDIDKVQEQEEQILEAKRLQELIQQRQEIERRIAELSILHNERKRKIKEQTYKIKKHDKRTEEIKGNNEKSDIIINNSEKRDEYSRISDALDCYKQTPTKKVQEQKEYEELYKDYSTVNEIWEQADREIKEIKQKIKEVDEQIKGNNLTPEEIKELQITKKLCEKELKTFISSIGPIKDLKSEYNKSVTKRENELKKRQKQLKIIAEKIEQYKEQSPAGYIKLKKQYDLISNGIIKGSDAQSALQNQIGSNKAGQLAHNIRGQIECQEKQNNRGSFSPTATPNNALSNSKNVKSI